MKINIRNFCLKTSLLIFMPSAFAAKHHKSQRGAHRGSRNTRESSRTISRESGVDRRRTFCDFSKYPWIMWTLCIIISPLNVALREENPSDCNILFFLLQNIIHAQCTDWCSSRWGHSSVWSTLHNLSLPNPPTQLIFVTTMENVNIFVQKQSCDITMVYNFTRSV